MWLAVGMSVGWIPKPGDQKSAGCAKLCGIGRPMGKSGMPGNKQIGWKLSIITN